MLSLCPFDISVGVRAFIHTTESDFFLLAFIDQHSLPVCLHFIYSFIYAFYLFMNSFIHFFFFFSLAPSVFNLLLTVKIEKHIQLFLGLNSFAYYLFLRLLLICLFTYLFIYLSFPHIIFPHLNSPNIPFPGFLISPFVRFSVFPIRPKMPGCSRWVHSSLLAAWLSIISSLSKFDLLSMRIPSQLSKSVPFVLFSRRSPIPRVSLCLCCCVLCALQR